jgi:hypothetical protein
VLTAARMTARSRKHIHTAAGAALPEATAGPRIRAPPPLCPPGFVSCGVVVLAFDLLLKRGPYYTPDGLQRLFALVSMQSALGLAAASALVAWHWRALSSRKSVIVDPLAARPPVRPLGWLQAPAASSSSW